ncbi:hypothetical protein BC940DRAFT_335928 [Gongronella butleri]|nr:hypothetical protein BC940DRAFT_335928 [Gongronella butleri]
MTTIEAPMPGESITNKPGSQQNSLYRTCQHVLQAVSSIDALQPFLNAPDGALNTPVNRLWHFCRQGAPLCILFNTLRPAQPIPADHQKPKAYVYHFIIACRDQLRFDENSLFTLKDVFHDDTNGFVRVVNILKQIVTLMESHGLIHAPSPAKTVASPMPKDTRDKLVMELVETERKYVHDLETLQEYMRQAHAQEVLPPDTLLQLFGNLDALVDCQRRFLVQVEAQADKAPQEQRFGLLFQQYESAFAVYEPFCANFQVAQDLVIRETQTLESLAHVLSPSFELPSMLIKPVQRICKYPLLMKKLVECTPTSWPYFMETEDGCEAIQRVAEKVNETKRLEENIVHVQDLKRRVTDWPADDIDNFGYLLLHDKFMIYRGDPGRELIVYLFEKCLFVCRGERDKEKDKEKDKKDKKKKKNSSSATSSSNGSSSATSQANGHAENDGAHGERLGVRGRILMSRVAQVNDTSRDAHWSLQVFWSEKYLQPGQNYRLDSFTMRCRNQEQLQIWEATLNKLIRQMKKQARETRLMQHAASAPFPTAMSVSSSMHQDCDCDASDDAYNASSHAPHPHQQQLQQQHHHLHHHHHHHNMDGQAIDEEDEDDEETQVEQMEASMIHPHQQHSGMITPASSTGALHPSIVTGTVTMTSQLTTAMSAMSLSSLTPVNPQPFMHLPPTPTNTSTISSSNHFLTTPGMTLPPLPRSPAAPASPTTKVASHPRFLSKMNHANDHSAHPHPYQQQQLHHGRSNSSSNTSHPSLPSYHNVPPTEYITQQMLNEPWDDFEEDYFTYASSSSSLTTPKTPTPFLPNNDKPLPQLMVHGGSGDQKFAPHTLHSNSISGASGNGASNRARNSYYGVSTRSRSQSSPNIHPTRLQQPNHDELPSNAAAAAAAAAAVAATMTTTSSSSSASSNHYAAQHHHHHHNAASSILRNDKRRSNGDQDLRRPLYSMDTYPVHGSPLSRQESIKVKVHHDSSIYVLVVPTSIDYKELKTRIQRKMKGEHALAAATILAATDLKYQDEDGDLITISSNDDLQMGFELRASQQAVNFYIY